MGEMIDRRNWRLQTDEKEIMINSPLTTMMPRK